MVVRPKSQGEFGRLTIAGQTAPPPGITLRNGGIAIRAHDVLIQHLAIRPGEGRQDPGRPGRGLANRDAIKVEAPPGEVAHDIVVDHVSASWATDETVSTWAHEEGSIHDVTFSNCIFSEALREAAPGVRAGYGPLGGRNSANVSFLRNLIALNRSRNPLVRDTVMTVEIVNNLVYWPHHDERAAICFGSAHPRHPDLALIGSVAGNVILRRPLGGGGEVSNIGIYVHDDVTSNLSLYLAGNAVFNPDTGVWHPTDGKPFSREIYRFGRTKPRTWTSNPFPFTGSDPWLEPPAVIEERLLAGAGKQPAFRDALDAGVVDKVRRRTGEWLRGGDLGADAWRPADVRRTRVLELPADPAGDADNNGYTNLEEWLHGWAAYVEGRTAAPPAATDVAQVETHQTPGVRDGMPVFYQEVKDRITHPYSWLSGNYSDFSDWKEQARARVHQAWLKPPPAAPWNPVVVAEEDRGSYVVRKIVFNVTGDSRLAAYLTVPKGDGPFPAVLLLHDHGGRYEIGKEKVIRPFDAPEGMAEASATWVGRLYGGRYVADELSKRGYVTFVTDAINWGERGGGAFAGQQALASNLMHLGMSFAGVTAWEDQRAAEFLAGLPEVDAQRVAAMGLSMGGYRTWQVAAMSDRIVAGVSICYMTTVAGIMVPGNNATKGGSAFSMLHPGLYADLDHADIASLAAPKPMLFYNGRLDRLFPQSSVQDAYAKLRRVWSSQGAGDRLETRTWTVEHVFDVPMQEAAFAWLDGYLQPGR